jgi:plastocyanin
MMSRPILLLLGLIVMTAAAWQFPLRGARRHEVRMIGDSAGYRFEPARLSIARGDTVVFRVVSGQPHTVAFDTAAIATGVARELDAHMSDRIGKLSGPLLLLAGDRYVISFADLPAGRYPFFCLPHLGLRMRGEIVVQ